jgi:hypothetical protein
MKPRAISALARAITAENTAQHACVAWLGPSAYSPRRSERSAARLAHQSGGLGVPSSNLGAPTIITKVHDNRVRLFTRNGNDWTDRYPWIVEDAARLPVRRAVMDAECCCDGADGVTDFNSLHSRLNDHNAFPYVFDLLVLEEADIRPLPLSERRKQLAKLLRKAKPVFD